MKVSTLQLPASRGRILDRNGQILAISINAPTISVNPQQFKASDEQISTIDALQMLLDVVGLIPGLGAPADRSQAGQRGPNSSQEPKTAKFRLATCRPTD